MMNRFLVREGQSNEADKGKLRKGEEREKCDKKKEKVGKMSRSSKQQV